MNTGPQATTMRRISEMTETRFDGVDKPYVPPKQLNISDSLACTGTGRQTSTGDLRGDPPQPLEHQ